MSLALYREFRPKTFEEVVGQEHITRTLKNQVKNGNTTHAYLFTGARGTGKTSCAKIFSRAINCLNNMDGSPCGKCANCLALNDINTDVLEIDAASNNRVDEIRDLRERGKYPPVFAKKKVYIIDEVHMLTDSAFNALLKTLEEPPEYVVFILATTEVHKLPATILSRLTRFDFRLLSVDELVGQLKKVFDVRNVSYDEESLFTIARLGEGSVRDMLSIADSVLAYSEGDITIQKTLEVLGMSRSSQIAEIVSNIGNGDIVGLITSIRASLNKGKNISVLCKELTEYFKNLLLVKQNITDFNLLNIMPTDLDSYKVNVNLFDNSQLKTAFEKLSRIELDLKFSLNPENLLEAVCVSIMKSADASEKVAIKPETKVANISNNVQPSVVNVNPQPTSTNVAQSVNISSQPKIESELKPVKQEETKINQPTPNTANVGAVDSESITRRWGQVLVKVKEKNMFAFSASLKNVYGVEAKGNTIILRTNDKTSYEIVDSADKKGVILDILKELNSTIDNIEVIYDENNKSQADIIKSLKETFLDKIKIKD